MKAKAYGRTKKKAPKDGWLSMNEITFVGSPAELRRIAAFLVKSAAEIEKYGESFGHNHLRDEKDLSPWSDDSVDVIVVRPPK